MPIARNCNVRLTGIVGAFGDQVVEQVQAFIIGLQGVDTISVLRDGQELYPQSEAATPADAAHAA